MAVLKLGSFGPEVRKLQVLLNGVQGLGVRLNPDGRFGPGTQDAVARFQRAKRLAADGVVGPATWNALGQRGSTPPAPSGDAGAPWMEIAKLELGIHEDALPGQHNSRIVAYHQTTTLKATTDETPWCSSFVNWVMVQAGHKGTNNALAKSWIDWGTPVAIPRAGAVAVIKKKQMGADAATGSSTGFHVGFYISGSDTGIRLLGGNQGDSVKYSTFALSAYDVKALRWPL